MRKLLDITGLAQWLGQPTGMTRVEAELAKNAPDDVEFVVYDNVRSAYRAIRPAYRKILIGTHAALDPTPLNARVARQGWKRSSPSLLSAIMTLERFRLRFPPLDGALNSVQMALLKIRKGKLALVDADGLRFSLYPVDVALGPPLHLHAGDRILASIADWDRRDPKLFAAYIATSGAELVPICYDMIPVTDPHFFQPKVVELFSAFWESVLPVSAKLIVTAHCVSRDVARFAQRLGNRAPVIERHALGADGPAARIAPLPQELQADRYALFVSTIEPRKNHAMLMRAWGRLCTRGWPQEHGVKLVFVGRPGWMVEELLQRLEDSNAFAGTLLHLPRADDALLGRLYRDCSFCLYPSRNEGFGLPIVEAFAFGKATIASTGGALPEVVDGQSPTLDPDDEMAWEHLIVDWFEQPELRATWEERIARRNRERPNRYEWAGAARGLLAAGGLIG